MPDSRKRVPVSTDPGNATTKGEPQMTNGQQASENPTAKPKDRWRTVLIVVSVLCLTSGAVLAISMLLFGDRHVAMTPEEKATFLKVADRIEDAVQRFEEDPQDPGARHALGSASMILTSFIAPKGAVPHGAALHALLGALGELYMSSPSDAASWRERTEEAHHRIGMLRAKVTGRTARGSFAVMGLGALLMFIGAFAGVRARRRRICAEQAAGAGPRASHSPNSNPRG